MSAEMGNLGLLSDEIWIQQWPDVGGILGVQNCADV